LLRRSRKAKIAPIPLVLLIDGGYRRRAARTAAAAAASPVLVMSLVSVPEPEPAKPEILGQRGRPVYLNDKP